MIDVVLRHIYPDLQIGSFRDGKPVQLRVGTDGALEIESWNDPRPQPTEAEIEAAAPEALAAAARAAIKPVTRRQMLTALHRAGLLATIKGAVAASGDIELQIAFDESQEFQRNNPFLATMAAALGKTDAEVDAIFALAATL